MAQTQTTAAYTPYDGGYIYRQNTTAQTETVLSTRFKIFTQAVGVSGFTLLGVTSSFGVSESRNIETIRGLGFGDQVAELVPGVTQPTSLSINRACLYLSNLQQMLGYKSGASGLVRSIKYHKWPFDIRSEILFSELANNVPGLGGPKVTKADQNPTDPTVAANPALYCISTIFEGCWVSSFTNNFSVDTAAVVEDMQCMVTDVFDTSSSISGYGEFIDSGNGPTDANQSMLFKQ